MDAVKDANTLHGWRKLATSLGFCVACVLLNFACNYIVTALGLPLYLDCLGIVLAGALGGYIPGIIVGYCTNLVTTVSDPSSMYWCLTSVLIAVAAAFFANRSWFNKPKTVILCILGFALIGGGLGSIITICLYGPLGGGLSYPLATAFAESGMPGTAAQLIADFLLDIVDKGITVLLAIAIMRLLPKGLRSGVDFGIWQQTPLVGEELDAAKHATTRKSSLRTKIIVIVSAVMLLIAVVTTSISYLMFNRSNTEAQATMAQGIVNLAAESVNANRIDKYLALGTSMPGYTETERSLAHIRDSFPEVQYIYVYQIQEDGCHVVFDPDTADEEGSDPGEVIPFDEAFAPYLDDLLSGDEIDPIVSNETYGWLLTVYKPLYNKNGVCTCYVAVDVSMDHLVNDGFAFLSRVLILFAAFFILVCVVTLWMAEYGIIMPINAISNASRGFAFHSEASRDEGVEQLRNLRISTGDEVENMYVAVTKMSEDTVKYIAESEEKAATIERMQENLIMVMADLVESRDQHTGDHVRKTAAYTEVIMREMRREGLYPDTITDEFIANVVKSAPLHDVGKIEVSDTILNKPGRLTDEEFRAMQKHTVAGKEILDDAVGAMSDPGYLAEAQRLAAFHHEKWNGTGYPYGLAGEEIPLSARIMAVADVFDALVSKRSYKDGMPIEKALQIIHDDAGTHFDPQVAAAFLNAEEEVRRVAASHGDDQGVADDIRDK